MIGFRFISTAATNRVRKSNGNLAANGTLYWEMTPGVVAETDLAGTTKSEYVFFDGERVARRDGPTGTGGVFYYFSDHLKTASVITDSAGVIKAESDYYPWGGELQFVNNDPNDYKFTGKKNDLETGLYYFGARYYSNGLGRWVSADWSATPVPVPYADFYDPQTLNLYQFVGGNPASKTDADGHDCEVCEITMKEIDKFAKPLIESAEVVLEKGGSALLRTAGTVAGVVTVVFTSTPAASSKELEHERKVHEQIDAQNKEDKTKATDKSPDPAAAAAGGNKKGGGRNEQKSNEKRQQSAQDKLAAAKKERDALASKPNKTAEDNAKLESLKKQVKHLQQKATEKSETHSRKEKH